MSTTLEDLRVCPSCNGTGKTFAIGIRYAPGHSGPLTGDFPCDRCGGTGRVLKECLDWIKHGKELKNARLANDMSLRDVAASNGMTATEASRLERGMLDNLHVSPDAWAF